MTPVHDLRQPLPDVSAWTRFFERADIPALAETVDALAALRANEELADANSIGEMIGGDPLMTLKVLIDVGRRGGQTMVTGVQTVIAALVMMGVTPFFRRFASVEPVEGRLEAEPQALAGLQQLLRRSHRGARFALALAIHRADPDAAAIHAAALLHDFAEMLLWCQAPQLALRIRALQEADPSLRSSVAQERVLHVSLAEVQQALVAAWHLPALLTEKSADAQAPSAGVRTVALGARLARHVSRGWTNAAVPDDVAEIAEFLHLSVPAAHALLMEVDVP